MRLYNGHDGRGGNEENRCGLHRTRHCRGRRADQGRYDGGRAEVLVQRRGCRPDRPVPELSGQRLDGSEPLFRSRELADKRLGGFQAGVLLDICHPGRAECLRLLPVRRKRSPGIGDDGRHGRFACGRVEQLGGYAQPRSPGRTAAGCRRRLFEPGKILCTGGRAHHGGQRYGQYSHGKTEFLRDIRAAPHPTGKRYGQRRNDRPGRFRGSPEPAPDGALYGRPDGEPPIREYGLQDHGRSGQNGQQGIGDARRPGDHRGRRRHLYLRRSTSAGGQLLRDYGMDDRRLQVRGAQNLQRQYHGIFAARHPQDVQMPDVGEQQTPGKCPVPGCRGVLRDRLLRGHAVGFGECHRRCEEI